MISSTAEYALRAIVHLARCAGPATTEDIARATGAPVDYLIKVLLLLARAGMVRSRRGPHGGYELIVAAERVTLAQVIEAAAPLRTPTPPGEVGSAFARLYRILRRMDRSDRRLLTRTTVADMAHRRRVAVEAPVLPPDPGNPT